jgi:hypothetical protein
MKRALTVTLVVLTLAPSSDSTIGMVSAQQQAACLHGTDETPADAARRRDAVRVMRAINTIQVQTFGKNRAYLNFRELTSLALPPRPTGFLTQLTVEGSTYALLLRDTADPCRYTLFSDQEGVIFVGSPLTFADAQR